MTQCLLLPVILNSRRDDQDVDHMYGKVLGRTLFGRDWCSTPKRAFRRATVNDAAFSPRGWEAPSSLLDDPIGLMDVVSGLHEMAPEASDDSEAQPGMPDAPWVVTETVDWVPYSPRSPRKMRLEKVWYTHCTTNMLIRASSD